MQARVGVRDYVEVDKENQIADEFLNILSRDGFIGHEKPFRSLWRRVMMDSLFQQMRNCCVFAANLESILGPLTTE